MLFHHYTFILLFLPCLIIGYIISNRYSNKSVHLLLIFSSLFFYGYHNLYHILLILFSISVNFHIGNLMIKDEKLNNLKLTIGIFFNIFLLSLFKYLNFLITNLNFIPGISISEKEIELPLAISFFTFQQIAYLVDLRKGSIKSTDFSKYTLFVVFFPQLIAGPIVRFQQIIKQFNKVKTMIKPEHMLTGFCLFSFGLFKKHYFADGVKPLADSLYNIVDSGAIPSIAEAWIGTIAFGLQIYFDFSGYSDMAIGLALMLGIFLPLNFNSPYKAYSVVDFWKRWHITLSEFLRDYLYFPLGGNRKGISRGIINAMIVMILGGLWHGASWTFIAWGIYHGVLIGVTHLIRNFTHCKQGIFKTLLKLTFFNRFTTFFLISIGWVFFRSENFQQSSIIIQSMCGFNGIDLSRSLESTWISELMRFEGFLPSQELDITLLPVIPIMLLVILFMPNTNQLFKLNPSKFFSVIPSKLLLFISGILFFFSIKIALEDTVYEFLYFQF